MREIEHSPGFGFDKSRGFVPSSGIRINRCWFGSLKAVSSSELIQYRRPSFIGNSSSSSSRPILQYSRRDLAMTGSQQQVHSAGHSDGEEHILDALLNPRVP
jgi:hypothetical protein